jgi:hypothetical protein
LEDSLGNSLPAVTSHLTKHELVVILQDHKEKIGLKLDTAISKLEARLFQELYLLLSSPESESGAKAMMKKPSASAQIVDSQTLGASDLHFLDASQILTVCSTPVHVALLRPAHAAAPPTGILHTGSDLFVDSCSKLSLSCVATPSSQAQPATASNNNLFVLYSVGFLSNTLETCCVEDDDLE